MLSSMKLATGGMLRKVRHASVLAAVPPSPHPTFNNGLHDSPHIVTPASSPLTTPSNNAFHPAFIPKKTKERLALNELEEVLKTAKILLKRLQSDFLVRQDTIDSLDTLDKVMKTQSELRKSEAKLNRKKNRKGFSD